MNRFLSAAAAAALVCSPSFAEEARGNKADLFRASQIAGRFTGLSVLNQNNEPVGAIRDMVIDISTGNVAYAVLAHDATAGFGGKLFAVPLQALKIEPDPRNPNSRVFKTNVEKAKLDAEAGFNKAVLPDEVSPLFSTAAGSVQRMMMKRDNLRKYSDLSGLSVRNYNGDKVGSVNDFMVDVKTGKIAYTAVSVGGFAGYGDKLYAAPFNAFEFKALSGNPNDVSAVTDADKNTLKDGTGFDEKNWPTEPNATLFKRK